MSRNLILVLMLLAASIGAWQHFDGDPQQPAQGPAAAAGLDDAASGNTVLVYGRGNCSYTQRMLASLRSSSVPVTYVDIDYVDANAAFHQRFDGSNLAGERGYALPVVEFAGRVSMRPDPDAVARHFRSAH